MTILKRENCEEDWSLRTLRKREGLVSTAIVVVDPLN